VPVEAVFSTKPGLTWWMIERVANDPLLVFGRVTGDEAAATTPTGAAFARAGA
jgi:hypothetical protein